MESKKEHNFRKLIQKAGVEKPSPGFSSMLMQKINAETEMNAIKEESLELLLKSQTSLSTPSQSFSHQIMNNVLTPKPIREEKIISNFAWFLIAVVFVVLAILTFSTDSPLTVDKPSFVSGTIKRLSIIPSVYPLSVFAGGMLVFLDYLLRQKFRGFKF